MRAVKIFEQVLQNKTKYKTLSLKFSANYEKGEESQSFGGTIRIKDDSLIWVSIVPALGIEAARVLITKDSIKFINRMKSTFYVGNYSMLRNMLNLDVDFDMLKSLLGNELFIYSRNTENDDNYRGFRSHIDSNMYIIQSLKERRVNRKIKKNKVDDLILQEFYIVPEIFKVARIFIKDFEYQKSINLNYSNFEKPENILFPKIMECTIINKNTELNISIEYTKVTVNKELEYPFSIPEKYTKTIE